MSTYLQIFQGSQVVECSLENFQWSSIVLRNFPKVSKTEVKNVVTDDIGRLNGKIIAINLKHPIGHFTVVCSVPCSLNGNEAGGDLALIKTSLLLSWKST